jgi:hypothetical protein
MFGKATLDVQKNVLSLKEHLLCRGALWRLLLLWRTAQLMRAKFALLRPCKEGSSLIALSSLWGPLSTKAHTLLANSDV